MAKLDALLELFIKKYVQCHACGNPETRIKIRKDMIHLMCKVPERYAACLYVLKFYMQSNLHVADGIATV